MIEAIRSHLLPGLARTGRRFVVCSLLLAGLICGQTGAWADIRYKAYAARLMTSLPDNAIVRPDLEAELARLASAERRRSGRRALASSDAQREGARAQAAEMILGNFVGHHTKAGFDFGDRFRAYMPGFEGVRGENAARDRQRGPADRRKARRLFEQWLRSRGHRRNLINPDYSHVSTGVIQIGNHIYAVQIFWEKQSAKPANSLFLN
ncbi:MAG: CAP domain-containing protein [Pseudomonadota bacterium]